jgi:hypothetical protein
MGLRWMNSGLSGQNLDMTRAECEMVVIVKILRRLIVIPELLRKVRLFIEL